MDQMPPDMTLGPERQIDEGLLAARPPGKGREELPQLLRAGRETLGALPRQLDQAVRHPIRRLRRVHLRPGRLHAHEAQVRELLHGPVDLRGGDAALAADRGRVGDPENHQGDESLPLVEGKTDLLEKLRIRYAHGDISTPESS